MCILRDGDPLLVLAGTYFNVPSVCCIHRSESPCRVCPCLNWRREGCCKRRVRWFRESIRCTVSVRSTVFWRATRMAPSRPCFSSIDFPFFVSSIVHCGVCWCSLCASELPSGSCKSHMRTQTREETILKWCTMKYTTQNGNRS